jgi:hypothetical protein
MTQGIKEFVVEPGDLHIRCEHREAPRRMVVSGGYFTAGL